VIDANFKTLRYAQGQKSKKPFDPRPSSEVVQKEEKPMKLFAGLNKAYDHSIYLCLVDSSGVVLSRTQFPSGEESHPALCSLLTALRTAYQSPLLLTLAKMDRWENNLIEALQTLPVTLLLLTDSQCIKANFYKRNPLEDYDPFERAMEMALLGALHS